MNSSKRAEHDLVQLSPRSSFSGTTSRKSIELPAIVEKGKIKLGNKLTGKFESSKRESESAYVLRSKQHSTVEPLPKIDQGPKPRVDVASLLKCIKWNATEKSMRFSENSDKINKEKEIEREKELEKIRERELENQKERDKQRLLNQQADQEAQSQNRPSIVCPKYLPKIFIPPPRRQLPCLKEPPRINPNLIRPVVSQVQPQYEKCKQTCTQVTNVEKNINFISSKTDIKIAEPQPETKLFSQKQQPIKLLKKLGKIEARQQIANPSFDLVRDILGDIKSTPYCGNKKLDCTLNLKDDKAKLDKNLPKVDTGKHLEKIDAQFEEINRTYRIAIAQKALAENLSELPKPLKSLMPKTNKDEFPNQRTQKQYQHLQESDDRITKIETQQPFHLTLIPQVNSKKNASLEESPVIEEKNSESKPTKNSTTDINPNLELLQSKQNKTYNKNLEQVILKNQNRLKPIKRLKVVEEVTEKGEEVAEGKKIVEEGEEVVEKDEEVVEECEEVVEEGKEVVEKGEEVVEEGEEVVDECEEVVEEGEEFEEEGEEVVEEGEEVVEEDEEVEEEEQQEDNDEEWEDEESEESEEQSTKLSQQETATEVKQLTKNVVKPKSENVEAPQRRKLIDILKRMNWITSVNPDSYQPAPEKPNDVEQSEEIPVSENTDYNDILETSESEEYKKENNLSILATTNSPTLKITENNLPQTSEDYETFNLQKEVIKQEPLTQQKSLIERQLQNNELNLSFFENEGLLKLKQNKNENPVTETLLTTPLKQGNPKPNDQINFKFYGKCETVDTTKKVIKEEPPTLQNSLLESKSPKADSPLNKTIILIETEHSFLKNTENILFQALDDKTINSQREVIKQKSPSQQKSLSESKSLENDNILNKNNKPVFPSTTNSTFKKTNNTLSHSLKACVAVDSQIEAIEEKSPIRQESLFEKKFKKNSISLNTNNIAVLAETKRIILKQTDTILPQTSDDSMTIDFQRKLIKEKPPTLQESLFESILLKNNNSLNKNNVALVVETKYSTLKKNKNILPQTSEDCKIIELQKETMKQKPLTLQESLLDSKSQNNQFFSSVMESMTMPKLKPQKYEKPLIETLSTKPLKKQDKLKTEYQANLKRKIKYQVDREVIKHEPLKLHESLIETLSQNDKSNSLLFGNKALPKSKLQKDYNFLNKNNEAALAKTKLQTLKKTEKILPQISKDFETVDLQKEVIKHEPLTLPKSLNESQSQNDESSCSLFENKANLKPKPQKVGNLLTKTLMQDKSEADDSENFEFDESQTNLICKQKQPANKIDSFERQIEAKNLKQYSTGKKSQINLIHGFPLPRIRPQSRTINSTLDKCLGRFSSTVENEKVSRINLKRQPSLLKCNMEKYKTKGEVVVEMPKCKVINVAPCPPNFIKTITTGTKIKYMELKYSDDSESEFDDTVQINPEVEDTKEQHFHSDSVSEEAKSIKLESVHFSYSKSDDPKVSFNCHLYKLRLRVKSITWKNREKMKSVILRFYSPFTREIATVDRRFVLPYFYTADIYCYVPYICPPEMIEKSLSHYAPRIFIYKRKTDVELARGTLNLRKSQLELEKSLNTIVPIVSDGRKLAEALVSLRLFNAGPVPESDEKANAVIRIIFKKMKNRLLETGVAKPQKEDRELKDYKSILTPEEYNTDREDNLSSREDNLSDREKYPSEREEYSSSNNDGSSEVPHSKVFKKRPFLYKKKKKSKAFKIIHKLHDESFVSTSSISAQTKYKQPKTIINNCKDIQTDVPQEDQVATEKPKVSLVHTHIESCTIIASKSKLTQTEKITKKPEFIQFCKDGRSKKKNKAKVSLEQSTSTISTEENEENLDTVNLALENSKYVQKNIVEPSQQAQEIEVKGRKPIDAVKVKVENASKMKVKVIVEKTKESKKSQPKLKHEEHLPVYKRQKEKKIKENFSETEEVKIQKQTRKLSSAPKKIDVRMSRRRSEDSDTNSLDFSEKTLESKQTSYTFTQYLEEKKLAEQFFRVCIKRKTPLFDKMTCTELKKFKRNYLRRLRANLTCDFETPPIRNNKKDKSKQRWMSHMRTFLHKRKRRGNKFSSSINNAVNLISELQDEVVPHDVLINNQIYHAKPKCYFSKLCKADVTTSTAYPLIFPPTAEAAIQTNPRDTKKFSAQAKESTIKGIPIIKSKPVVKYPPLHPCLIVVDTIPVARNSDEKFINQNILYEKIRAYDRSQQGEIKNAKQPKNILHEKIRTNNMKDKVQVTQLVKGPKKHTELVEIKQPKNLNLDRSLLIEKEFFQPNCESIKNKGLHEELQDILKNISLEVHYLKHRALALQKDVNGDYTSVQLMNNNFDKLLVNFKSLVANNEERDFIIVYRELQQLQNLVYNTFKKFSQRYIEKLKTRSRSKQEKTDDDYESYDKNIKLIYENHEMINKQINKSVSKHNKCSSESNETVIIPECRNKRLARKRRRSGYKSESSLIPLYRKSSKSSLSILHSGRPIEIEKIQIKAIKKKMKEVQIKLRNYIQYKELYIKSNNKTDENITQMTKNILKLLHEWRRLKSYVEQVCKA